MFSLLNYHKNATFYNYFINRIKKSKIIVNKFVGNALKNYLWVCLNHNTNKII